MTGAVLVAAGTGRTRVRTLPGEFNTAARDTSGVGIEDAASDLPAMRLRPDSSKNDADADGDAGDGDTDDDDAEACSELR